jgi:hypothetical protein
VLARECGRLALLVGAALTLLLYAASPQSARVPQIVARYLLGLLIALGAVLAPLWEAARDRRSRQRLFSWVAMAVVALVYVCTMAQTLGQIPADQGVWAQQRRLVADLERLGATRIYSVYWTCGMVIFLSHERVICATLTGKLQPDLDRYLPYRTMVNDAARPFYVFPRGSSQAAAVAAIAAVHPGTYARWQMDGYLVYRAVT